MTIATNAWTNPRNGETRHYINDFWADMLGLHIERYNTGNISYASIDGEKISNGRAGRLSGKLWADENGNLHLDYFNGDDFYTQAEALERITKYIAENGGLDFMAAEEEEEPAVEAVEEHEEIVLTAEEVALIESEPEPTSNGKPRPRDAWASRMARKIAKARGVEQVKIHAAYVSMRGGKVDPLATEVRGENLAVAAAFHGYFEEA